MLRRMLEYIRFYVALIDDVLVIVVASGEVSFLLLSSIVSAWFVIALFISSVYVSKFQRFPSSMF